ncbi:MAG: enoyl-CoA hydratase/isomerase family protein [Burkholderiales bacterium]
MSNELLSKLDGPVLRITINRPDAGNGMSDAMALELTELLENAHKTAQFVVLKAAGKDFCIGRASMGGAPQAPNEALERRDQSEVVFNCYGSIRRCPLPVVGIVQGRALGFGASIAALCDITIAASDAKFQIPEMGHNIQPTMVMSAMIDRIPRKHLAYLVYSTDVVSADDALKYGMVSKVVAPDQLDKAEADIVARLTATPQPAQTGVKEYLRTAGDMHVAGAVDYARNIHAVVNSSSKMQRK